MATTDPAAMRLIIASIQDYDAATLLRDLAGHGWGATQVATTSGSTTVLIGVPTNQVRRVLRLIDEHCRRSTELLAADPVGDEPAWYPPPVATTLGGAAVSVLKVVRFERL